MDASDKDKYVLVLGLTSNINGRESFLYSIPEETKGI